MLPEQALHALLQSSAAVSAMVEGRIYPNVLPQDVTYPAIAYRVASTAHVESLDGSSGLRRTRFRIYSATKGFDQYGAAKLLDEAVRLSLQGFSGDVELSPPESPEDTLRVQGISALSAFDQYDDLIESHQIL